MKTTVFQKSWGTARAIAIGMTILMLGIAAIRAHSYTIEMDYTGPGSEAESLNRASEDRQNREAFERPSNERSERDQERAESYERDHVV